MSGWAAIVVTPPADAPVGDYEIRVRTESSAHNRRVSDNEKIFRISVKARRNLLGAGLLVTMLLGLIAGLGYVAMRLTRR